MWEISNKVQESVASRTWNVVTKKFLQKLKHLASKLLCCTRIFPWSFYMQICIMPKNSHEWFSKKHSRYKKKKLIHAFQDTVESLGAQHLNLYPSKFKSTHFSLRHGCRSAWSIKEHLSRIDSWPLDWSYQSYCPIKVANEFRSNDHHRWTMD